MSNKVTKMCKVSGGGLPEGFEAKIEVEIDYDGVDSVTERSWATSHLIIAIQRVLKRKSVSELNELAKTGYKTRALDAGKSVPDPTQAYRARFERMTLEEQQAELARLEEITRRINGGNEVAGK